MISRSESWLSLGVGRYFQRIRSARLEELAQTNLGQYSLELGECHRWI